MPYFFYEGKKESGKVARGSLPARDIEEAWVEFHARRIEVSSLRQWHGSHWQRFVDVLNRNIPFFPSDTRKPTRDELISLTNHLAATVKAGLPVAPGLSALARDRSRAGFVMTIDELQTKLRAGESLGAALTQMRGVFPRTYVNAVAAGERSGSLPRVLSLLGKHLERTGTLRRRMVSLLVPYVFFVGLAAMGVAMFLVTFIVPTFASMFVELDTQLPASTRLLISASEFITRWGYLAIAAAFPFGVGILCLLAIHRVRLKLPLLGPAFRYAAMARFFDTLGVCLSAGTPLTQAVQGAGEAAIDRELERRMARALPGFIQDGDFSSFLEETRFFPRIYVWMLSVAEGSGDLEKRLGEIANLSDEEAQGRLFLLERIALPLVVGCAGTVIGFIVISMFQPLVQIAYLSMPL